MQRGRAVLRVIEYYTVTQGHSKYTLEWDMCGTVYQGQCSLLSHWTFFDAALKLNCSSVLTTDIVPVKRLYCCVTHFHFAAAFCCGRNLEVYRL